MITIFKNSYSQAILDLDKRGTYAVALLMRKLIDTLDFIEAKIRSNHKLKPSDQMETQHAHYYLR